MMVQATKEELRKKIKSLKGKLERRKELQESWALTAFHDPSASQYVDSVGEEIRRLLVELDDAENRLRALGGR